MEWHNPQILFAILPLCSGWLLLAMYSDRRRRAARLAFADASLAEKMLPAPSTPRFWVKLCCQLLAIVSGIMALAGPRYGTITEQVVPRGSDLYVLIDVSRSMLAQDVVPTRLDRARADVLSLLNRLDGERIGLIAFAGQAVVKCPLTTDYDSFRRALAALDPDSAPRGGTAIGDAIRKSLEVFSAGSGRDQAVLLITDGDDQESFPLEAAAVAAENKVTIFTVGLGDAELGSRVPEKGRGGEWTEYNGQQIWSKLNSPLLKDIAVRTSGVYVPAGTKAFDLGSLYIDYLQGKRGSDTAQSQLVRKAERFQIFLAVCLILFVVDLFLSPLRQTLMPRTLPSTGAVPALIAVTLTVGNPSVSAGEPPELVRDGVRLFQEQKFAEAAEQFGKAAGELPSGASRQKAVAAFDEACALHRKGDYDKARDAYLEAGLSPDRSVAVSAHFNLGNLIAEKARALAGDRPEAVAESQRAEILDLLQQAIGSYRHCLQLQKDHSASRRNLELLRNWIRHYSDRWRQHDLQKRRDELNLIEFLDFLMTSQSELQNAARSLPPSSPSDLFAELKRRQDELREEIPPLKDKIRETLAPEPQTPGGNAASGTSGSQSPAADAAEGITLLQSWADKSGDQMQNAARQLARSEPSDAAKNQQAAWQELDRIRDAVGPFQLLLNDLISGESDVTNQLRVHPEHETAAQTSAEPTASPDPPENAAPQPQENAITSPAVALDSTDPSNDNVLPSAASDENSPHPQISEVRSFDLPSVRETQERMLQKSRLLAPKAEAELQQLEQQSAGPGDAPPNTDAGPHSEGAPSDPPDPNSAETSPAPEVNPEDIKAGYRKAIELSPAVVAAIENSAGSLNRNQIPDALKFAEEAKRLLEEIRDAQPRSPPQEQQDQSDPSGNDSNSHDQKDNSKESQDQQPKQQQNPDDKSQSKESDSEKSRQPENGSQKDKPRESTDKETDDQTLSKDRIEETLRKVRERQQAKQDRDKAARVGRSVGRPVEKDW